MPLKWWYNEFNRGRHSITYEFPKARPKSVVEPEYINAVQKLIMQDRHVTYCEIEATSGISFTSIYILSKKYRELVNKTQTIYYSSKFILLPSK